MNRIPITVLTGFLGSGKTSLLNAALRQSNFSRTAVIVNEFGDVGLDHELIESSRDAVVLLDRGCLCCAVKSDLITTLIDLYERRRTGSVPSFERVVIETSGLAEPSGVVSAITGDLAVSAQFALSGIVTTIDSVNGASTLAEHDEAQRQLALADRIVVTKTDIQPLSLELRQAIDAGNCMATWVLASDANAAELLDFDSAPFLTPVTASRPAHRLRLRIRTLTLVRDEPIDPEVLEFFLTALEQSAGPALLRVKALVCLSTQPDRPVVVHGVQRLVPKVVELDSWPSEDHRTRIVVIAMDEAIDDLAELLEAVEALIRRTRSARLNASAVA
jgi:G3E family GTPase